MVCHYDLVLFIGLEFLTGSELGGFQCSRTTMHLRCQVCGMGMPSRPDIGVPQKCKCSYFLVKTICCFKYIEQKIKSYNMLFYSID